MEQHNRTPLVSALFEFPQRRYVVGIFGDYLFYYVWNERPNLSVYRVRVGGMEVSTTGPFLDSSPELVNACFDAGREIAFGDAVSLEGATLSPCGAFLYALSRARSIDWHTHGPAFIWKVRLDTFTLVCAYKLEAEGTGDDVTRNEVFSGTHIRDSRHTRPKFRFTTTDPTQLPDLLLLPVVELKPVGSSDINNDYRESGTRVFHLVYDEVGGRFTRVGNFLYATRIIFLGTTHCDYRAHRFSSTPDHHRRDEKAFGSCLQPI